VFFFSIKGTLVSSPGDYASVQSSDL